MARLKRPDHGGNVYAASRNLGCDLTQIIDFSASINPLGPSPHVWGAITDARHLLGHYPDPECWDLRQALARCWQVDPRQIVVGNGSTELIDVIPRALNIHHLVIVQPTFSEYAASMIRAGRRVKSLYSRRKNQYALPIDRLCRLMEMRQDGHCAFDGVVLCNPNSPTGQACGADDVARLARAARRRGIWLVIDEAFADYCPERSVLLQAASWPHVVVLRSMTKFYGLPGLRVGYAVASPSAVKSIERQLPPWSVNVMGQVAALAALNDTVYTQKSVHYMTKERERLASLLTALPGCVVMPTYANYVFMELPRGWHAREMTERLKGEGLLIRDCSTVPGANSRSIRLAVRSQRENDRLVQVFSRLLRRKVS